MTIWNLLGFFFSTFIFAAYLLVLFWVLTDLFRDHSLNGWWKALWVIFLIFFPFLTALVYMIARGNSMNARTRARAGRAVVPEDYSRAEPSLTPAADIAQAKSLLDAGIINQGEFDALKAKALGAF